MSETKNIKPQESILQPNKLIDLKNRFFQERDRYIRVLLSDPNFAIAAEHQPQALLEDLLSSIDVKSLIPNSDEVYESGMGKMQIARILLSTLPKIQKAINVGSIPVQVASLPRVKNLKDLSDTIGLPAIDLWIIGSTRGQYSTLSAYLKANVFNLIPTVLSNFLNL